MSIKSVVRPDSANVVLMTTSAAKVSDLLQQYGSFPFAGTDSALYERHLIFDRAIDPKVASARERFEAFSHSIRDILTQRWVQTKNTYERQNAKRIYYLSMEFLIGRSLTNNVSNLLLDPLAQLVCREKDIDWMELIEQEPDAGLGNGGLGRLAACFIDSMATMQLPATGYGLRYEYGMFKQSIVEGWQKENPDNWLRDSDPWEIARPHEQVEIKLNVSFRLQAGKLEVVRDRPSSLIGIPFDRPVVGYGGKTINTLRLWVEEVKARVSDKAVTIRVSSSKVEDGVDHEGKAKFKSVPKVVAIATESDMKPELVLAGPAQRGEVNVYVFGVDSRKHYFDGKTGAALGSQLRPKSESVTP